MRLGPALLFACVLAAGPMSACKSTGIPSDAKTTVISFPDLDCSDCGETMARTLIDEDGVYKTAFDKRRVELTVVADPKIDALALATTKRPADEHWHLLLGAGHGAYVPWQRAPESADVKEVAKNGEDVADLRPFLAVGKVTLFDFSAKWCEPCRRLDEHVLALMAKRDDVAYRKLDIGDWDTPLAAHYLSGVKELPHVVVFDRNGKEVATLSGLDVEALDRAIDSAAR